MVPAAESESAPHSTVRLELGSVPRSEWASGWAPRWGSPLVWATVPPWELGSASAFRLKAVASPPESEVASLRVVAEDAAAEYGAEQ